METRSVRRRLFPERDSPNNPFLDDKKDGGSDVSATTESPDAGEAEPKTPQPYIEKPTVTYVLYVHLADPVDLVV